MSRRLHGAAAALVALLAGCGDDGGGAGDDPGRPSWPALLSEWGLFADGALQVPAEGVYRYELTAPLFSDYAAKHRFIAPPPGEAVGWSDDGELDYPDGTVVVKTFSFLEDFTDPASAERLIETRLLIREGGAWVPQVYLWDEAQTDAVRSPIGAQVPVAFVDPAGRERAIDYIVPNTNDCARCHEGVTEMRTLGPRADQLDRDVVVDGAPVDQLAHLTDAGLFAPAPPPPGSRVEPIADPADETAPLDDRARAYLHANCAHCHSPDGNAQNTGFFLGRDVTDPFTLGVCRRPVSAGPGAGELEYDVVPGRPDLSIVVFRMASDEPEIKMPELPTLLPHDEGVQLVSDWIAAMPPASCTPEAD